MDDSSLFMQWAMDTLQQENPVAVVADDNGGGVDTFPSLQALRNTAASRNGMAPAEAAAGRDNSWSSGDTITDSGGGGNTPAAAAIEHDGWSPSPKSVRCAPSSSSGSTSYRPVNWNFSSAMAQAQPSSEAAPNHGTAASAREGGGAPDLVYGSSPPSRRASAKSTGSASTGHTSAAPYTQTQTQDHIMAERRRREKMNQRFIELSAVIPGLKKMDKATILSDAVRYVRELQGKLDALQDDHGGGGRSIESVVLVKKPCIAAAADGDGSCPSPTPASAAVALPEMEARVSEGSVVVKIHCENATGVLVRLLGEVEGLGLTITHANALPFPPCTVMVTIMAKVDEGFNIKTEDIIGRLNSALLHQAQAQRK